MSSEPQPSQAAQERVLVCGVILPGFPTEFDGELSEISALVRAAGAQVVGTGVTQKRHAPHPATLLGKGKVEEIGEDVQSFKPDAVVVDNDLSPAQIRNLEKAWELRVVDRSELILDIFANRAQTRQASLQVELAQNEYLLPRLRRMWTHLERMEGAIGTRGPGETQLETDRRLLDRRISDLRAQLKEIEKRKRRQLDTRSEEFKVGLVGYTNTGKSTLLNRLTGSNELVEDMPFATLDTRTRKWILPDQRTVLLSDTVGFLQRLPHHLVASFHATLEETIHADLLLHVVDASHPDAATQMKAVDEVLAEVAPGLEAHIVVFNKVDRVPDPIHLHLLLGNHPAADVVYSSAHTGEGIGRLTECVQRRLDQRSNLIQVDVSAGEGRLVAQLRAGGGIIEEEFLEGSILRLRLRVSETALGNLQRAAKGRAQILVLEPARSPRAPT
jgi:GTP-binding protein HflX